LFQDLALTLFFTPDDGQRRHHLNFELFTAEALARWQAGASTRLTNFGAGMLVARDGDPHTGERLWRGPLLVGQEYFLAVQNGTEVTVDYWLFQADISHPQLGAEAVPAVEPPPGPGTSPRQVLSLQSGRHQGRLAPGQQRWYSFSSPNLEQEFFEPMALTMVVTPAADQQLQVLNFEIFTAAGAAQGVNVGAGGIVVRDQNPLTGERFWSGWLVDGQPYYLRVSNGSQLPVDYWLFTGDLYQPELSPLPAGS
jgi:hypothetical protein